MVGLFSISLSVLCIFDEPLMPLLYFSSLEINIFADFFSLHDGLFCISLSFFVSLISLCCCHIFTPKPLIVILCSLCYIFLDFGIDIFTMVWLFCIFDQPLLLLHFLIQTFGSFVSLCSTEQRGCLSISVLFIRQLLILYIYICQFLDMYLSISRIIYNLPISGTFLITWYL